jgi:hypothetical protein
VIASPILERGALASHPTLKYLQFSTAKRCCGVCRALLMAGEGARASQLAAAQVNLLSKLFDFVRDRERWYEDLLTG